MLQILMLVFLLQTPGVSLSPQRLWESTSSSRVLATAIAPGATCMSTLTTSAAEVRDAAGRLVWSSPIVGDAQDIGWGRIAVSQQCDLTAVFLNRSARPSTLQIFGRNGSRASISLDGMVGLAPNATNVSSLSISPDGKLLAVGFEAGRLWIVTRSGTIQRTVGPFPTAPQVDAEFSADSKRLVLKGWFSTGVMTAEGNWLWQSESRNLVANRSLSLFAALTAPMHGPQGGDIAILDAEGNPLWKESAWNASMAIAPDGSFAAFATTAEKTPQPTTPPFPVAPELVSTPEVWLRDKTGKVLARRQVQAIVAGVSADSKCVILQEGADVVGTNVRLMEVWRLRNAQLPRYEGNLIIETVGNTIRASRMPACK